MVVVVKVEDAALDLGLGDLHRLDQDLGNDESSRGDDWPQQSVEIEQIPPLRRRDELFGGQVPGATCEAAERRVEPCRSASDRRYRVGEREPEVVVAVIPEWKRGRPSHRA